MNETLLFADISFTLYSVLCSRRRCASYCPFYCTFCCPVAPLAPPSASIRYRISDSLTLETYRDFEAALKVNPAIHELEFFNSNDSKAYADSIVNLFQLKIDELKLHTYARGFCDSTCAFIFLMGHQRSLLKGTEDNPTFLRLHPIFNSNMNQVVSFSTDKYIQEISSRSGNKISQTLLQKMYPAAQQVSSSRDKKY
ncbi:hypothetical protein [Undibacterium sp. TJN19]|uniref:hypothetical protein n=1 Tax=Undibacterium sp. TJN19 TaxID=3413055 RepID=UPI003BF2A3BF